MCHWGLVSLVLPATVAPLICDPSCIAVAGNEFDSLGMHRCSQCETKNARKISLDWCSDWWFTCMTLAISFTESLEVPSGRMLPTLWRGCGLFAGVLCAPGKTWTAAVDFFSEKTSAQKISKLFARISHLPQLCQTPFTGVCECELFSQKLQERHLTASVVC